MEIPGDVPALGYSLSRAERFTDELIDRDGKIYRYRKGPQPQELGGQRALDFVLDNRTLQPFNRTLCAAAARCGARCREGRCAGLRAHLGAVSGPRAPPCLAGCSTFSCCLCGGGAEGVHARCRALGPM